VRDLGLPREALVNVIVRGDEAIPPRGSTRIESGDRLHVLVREEVVPEFEGLIERWQTGPRPSATRPPMTYSGHPPVFSVRPWRSTDGDPARPRAVAGRRVVERLRSRHDSPGSVVALDDGRYAATGSLLIIGSASQVRGQALKCMRQANDDTDRAWWREVIGALAV
jgi:cell volume regulation protein A